MVAESIANERLKAIRELAEGRVPEKYIPHVHNRQEWRHFGMWGIVDLFWTKKLASFISGRKCLEVMAGRGWLASALRKHGVDVISTGQLSGSYDTHSVPGTVTEVEEMHAIEAMIKFASDAEVLLVSWPVADETMFHALRYWDTEKPIVFVGEWYSDLSYALSGCASDAFFMSVEKDETIDLGYPDHRNGIDIATVCYKKPD